MKDMLQRLLEVIHWLAFCFASVSFAGMVYKVATKYPLRDYQWDQVTKAILFVVAIWVGPPLVRYIVQGRWIWFPWIK